MASHHRSGGPPALMDDVPDFDRSLHSQRFEGGRGGRGRGGGMRGRGDGGGMRGRGGGDGGFGPRGGSRGGRGDFHQRDRFNNNNFNRSFDEQRGGGDGGQSKMPSLFDVDQQPLRSFDRDNNRGGGQGRMPFPRGEGGAGRGSSGGDDRYRHSGGSKQGSTDGPPPLLDFTSEKPNLTANASNNSLPSLLSVQVESSGVPPPGSELNKPIETHKEHQHGDNLNTRSDNHSSARDNEGRYRDRDSRKSSRGGFNRSSSFNRDRSRSPRDRDRDRDRHGPPRDDRRGGRGGRGGGGGGGGRGGHNNPREPHQSRFGSDNNQPPWHDRREGGRGGGGRGGFHDRQHDMGGHFRPNEQLPPDNHPFNRDGRPNYDAPPPSQNRPFQENFQPGNYDSMGPNQLNRTNLQQPSNFNQGPPPHNRPDFYPPNTNNPSYQQHNTRSGGRPSRFSDRQDDYEDDRPLTKPNISLPNVTTTAPLYMNQPTNSTFSQARPTMSSTYSSQQPPSTMFPQGAPPPSQFGWPNQQQGQSNSQMTQSLLSLASNDQQNPNMSGPPPPSSFYGSNNDFHRQQAPPSANQYYSGVPPVPPQTGNKPPNANVPSSSVAAPTQQPVPPATGANTAAATNAVSTDPWQQYYQQYWQYMQQQQQQQQAAVQPPSAQMGAQQPFQQSQTGATAGLKQPANTTTAAGNTQDGALNQANTNAWTQYW
ncbi:unnamed protein product [Rotaria sp. Silwood2]|nr:unnamed protein product [Rotaria sp. Silwood2]